MSSDSQRRTILILGGYGTFGGRLAHLLAPDPRLALVIAGRSQAKADAFCRELPLGADRRGVALDRDGELRPALAEAGCDLLVDASGPFQAYGDAPYRVVEACLALGISYVDLADSPDFVAGIRRYDTEAQRRGTWIVSGASTFPALSGAAVRSLAEGLGSVESIVGGLAPSPFARVGPNVVRAIAAYAGRPIRLMRNGRPALGLGLIDSLRATVAPPGAVPLRSRRLSLVEVPDLRLLPEQWPGLHSVWVGAAPAPEILHRALGLGARLVRWRLLPSLSRLADLFGEPPGWARWGEDRGGLFVAVRGRTRQGRPVERTWHLVAEGRDGPDIPAMAVAALVGRMLDGQAPADGARPATNELELADFASLFARKRIAAGRHETFLDGDDRPLFARLLGEAWERLPGAVRAMHDGRGPRIAQGRAAVERGRGLLSRLVGRLMGFPNAAPDVPVRVAFEPSRGEEVWTRTFGRKTFASRLAAGRGRSDMLLVERFGPLACGMALVAEPGVLRLVPRGVTLLGVPIPAILAPCIQARETQEDGRFRFDVAIALPLIGPVVRYRGWLILADEPRAPEVSASA